MDDLALALALQVKVDVPVSRVLMTSFSYLPSFAAKRLANEPFEFFRIE